jgi:5-methylcytosine-specific restriction endonuclease McrA
VITAEDYRKVCATLYAHDRERWRRKLQASAPKGVKLQIPADEVLPYTQAQFTKWLWTKIQLQAIPCPFCRAPIDILSMQLDHKTPLRRGGGMEFENRECICKRCNQAKGEFTREEYALLVEFMQGPGIHMRARLEGVLISGSIGKMMRHFPRGKAKKVFVQPGLDLSGLGTF